MIDIGNVDFSYGRGDFRLRISRLEVMEGEKAALIGPSGSGKTTFLNLVSGTVLPLAGTVRVSGQDVASLSDAARREFRITHIGFVFQDFELLEYLSVLDNIVHPYRINRALQLNGEVRARARQLAAETGLSDKLRRWPDQLSQGERQRVAICRALLGEPKLLLADEPTGNLDSARGLELLELLRRIHEDHGTTMVLVTHDPTAAGFCPRVIKLRDGRVEEDNGRRP